MRLIEQLRHEHEICVACPPRRAACRDPGQRARDAPRPSRGGAEHAPPSVAGPPIGLGQLTAAGVAVARACPALRPRRDSRQQPARRAHDGPADARGRAARGRAHARPTAARPLGRGVRSVVARNPRRWWPCPTTRPAASTTGSSRRSPPGLQRHRSRSLPIPSAAGGAPARAARPRGGHAGCWARSRRSRRGRVRTRPSAPCPRCAPKGSNAHMLLVGESPPRKGRALRQPRVPAQPRGSRRRARCALRGSLLGAARGRGGGAEGPRPLAPPVLERAVRAGDRREHGARHASARELHGGRHRGGAGRITGACSIRGARRPGTRGAGGCSPTRTPGA